MGVNPRRFSTRWRIDVVPVNLVNLERVTVSYGAQRLLDEVSLGVAAGDRVGVVGRNGSGKTTLLRTLTGTAPPDSGRVTITRGLTVGYLRQDDELDPTATVRASVLGGRADHEWAAVASMREVVQVLLSGIDLDRPVAELSGGERRRTSLAQLLLDPPDLVVLDEPTNHLDVEAVDWLARRLNAMSTASAGSALVVVTHDRWFLDAVTTTTWELHDGVVEGYDGGYAAYVLARAERDRQASAMEATRRNLARKELAWLRRGAPARTSKPKFRIEAASALIADEPAPRDRLELERFATGRLGKDVVDVEEVSLRRGDQQVLRDVTWRLGPGDRVGVVGVNGVGKTSLLRLVAGSLPPDEGVVRLGRTVDLGQLTQDLVEIDPAHRVLEWVEEIARIARTTKGEVSASSLLERFGFTGDRLTARLGDLSGGERRRLQVLRLLLAQHNVLLLDEPTNDLDIDTLVVIEDYLDSWPGTLVVVSHDRYFLERVCDTTYGMVGDGSLRLLTRGIDDFLAAVAARETALLPELAGSAPSADRLDRAAAVSEAGRRAARKEAARLERQVGKLADRERRLREEMTEHVADFVRLGELQAQLDEVTADREAAETSWLEAAAMLE
jgi:ABC transport system ATP-binding/permease protein